MTSECRFRFKENKWELFVMIEGLGEGVFTGVNFSEVVNKALVFTRKRVSQTQEENLWKRMGGYPDLHD
jgi:hypothetical protein